MTQPAKYPWLFSRSLDLTAFLGSAIVSLLALAIGGWWGALQNETPGWAWVPFILLIDVAHVYSTLFRVYFDPAEMKRRLALYLSVPFFGWVVAVVLYSEGELVFWRVLAYLAVFHFVRQQYGWVALYRSRGNETDKVGKWIDTAAIYMATVYPLIYWHSHLPRNFDWFLPNDFVEISARISGIAFVIYVAALTLYVAKSVRTWITGEQRNPGKDIVVATTALCWYVGIVTFNSDYAFTVTNVIIHGVPYMVLVYWYRWMREPAPPTRRGLAKLNPHVSNVIIFLGTIWMLAYVEELFWSRGDSQRHTWLFGEPLDLGAAKWILLPLLAVPQLTHYVLDGFIWRRRTNPALNATLQRPT